MYQNNKKEEAKYFLAYNINTLGGIITNYTLTESLEITSENFNPKEITFKNCKFYGELYIKNISCNKIKFIDCEFEQRVIIKNSHIDKLVFLKCKFNHYFGFNTLHSKEITFKNNQLQLSKELVIDQFYTESLFFTRNISSHNVKIIPMKISMCTLEGSTSQIQLSISQRNRETKIKTFNLNYANDINTDILIRHLKINQFHLFGEINNSTLSVTDVSIATSILSLFTNRGNVSFGEIKPLNEQNNIIIKDSSLGDMIVSNINFELFNRILVKNSNMLDLIPININWCKNNISDVTKNELKENYRQLKLVNFKNGDTPSKLHFEKLEYETYYEILKEKKGNWTDKFILFLSSWSNNFGQDFSLAFNWIIVLSIILYTLIKYQLGHTSFNHNLILGEIGSFINFLNPTHNVEKVFFLEKNYQGNIVLFDGVGKIINAYLIFQLISSFRKYSKK
ncbi:hypothetical protein ACIGCP_19480 [Cellulophaga baltica]|uniref:hypothetical protein n=1 Tax=Cellulophaga baltica TaxID=76594 RepID=UPI0037C56B85